MTRTGKGWRTKLRNSVAGFLNFLILLLKLIARDKQIYFPLNDIEHSSVWYLLMAYREAAERLVLFPNYGNALEAIERIEAEMERRDGLECARREAEWRERDAIYEELQRRAERREQKWRKRYPENFTNWSGILRAWYRRDRCRSTPHQRR
jgi:hypothetical protein